MPGKEFKAKGRTVQKMSRDGLVEENLRTGESRRLQTDPEGVRIGDRPMENLLDLPEDAESRDLSLERGEKVSRPGLSGDARAGSTRNGLTHFREPDVSRKDSSTRKRKMRKNREPSAMEAPLPSGHDPYAEKEDSSTLLSDNSNTWSDRLKSDSESSIRLESSRQGLSVRESPFEEIDISEDSRRQKARQKSGALYGAENGQQGGSFSSDTGTPAGSSYSDKQEEQESESSEDSARAQSLRAQQARGHPASQGKAINAPQYAGDLLFESGRKRNNVHADTSGTGKGRLREDSSDFDGLDDLKDEIRAKQKKERLNHEQRKARQKELDDDGRHPFPGPDVGLSVILFHNLIDVSHAAGIGSRRRIFQFLIFPDIFHNYLFLPSALLFGNRRSRQFTGNRWPLHLRSLLKTVTAVLPALPALSDGITGTILSRETSPSRFCRTDRGGLRFPSH